MAQSLTTDQEQVPATEEMRAKRLINRLSAREDSDGSDGTIGWLVKGLGWLSVGLGAIQLIAPGSLARMIGVRTNGKTVPVLRVIGLREVASGVGILSSRPPTNWLRGRAGSDLMDLALLGSAFRSRRNELSRLTGATVAVAGVTALDVFAARAVSQRFGAGANGTGDESVVRSSITIVRPVEEVFGYWHDFSNLPRFMPHLARVEKTGDKRWHWVAKARRGRTIEWDAEVISDVPNELIAWRSLPGSNIETTGTVLFRPAPGDRGTEVHVSMRYALPGGKVAATLSRIFSENPDREIYDDLRAFKQELETGEVVKSDAVLSGGRLHQRPGQPMPASESAASAAE